MTRDAENTAEVVVPDRQLSLAIGKEGQNARLAAKLTGWRIDIKSQTAYEAELAEKGITPEEARRRRAKKRCERSRAAAAALAEEARVAATTRPLTPEEEIALRVRGARSRRQSRWKRRWRRPRPSRAEPAHRRCRPATAAASASPRSWCGRRSRT